jgi:hypothetical protein
MKLLQNIDAVKYEIRAMTNQSRQFFQRDLPQLSVSQGERNCTWGVKKENTIEFLFPYAVFGLPMS